jgi:hypothetical protein
MTMKKISIYIISFSIVLCFNQSCSDYLTEEPIADVSAASYYTTPQGLEDAVKSTYAATKTYFGVERGFTMNSFGTDLYRAGSDGSHKGIGFYDGRLNPSESYFRDTWRDFYRGINQANAVINRSQSIEGLDPDVANSRLAEVRFLRGMYYFILVQTYGDVHLSLEETEGVEIEANRTAASEVYAQAIIPDLEFAIANLPDEQSEFGRATKPAAEFLLAKVFMRRAYSNGSGDAAEAERLMSNVINNYNFALLPDFSDLWVLGNEQNSEIIFSIQNNKAQVDEGLDGNGHRGHLYFLMEYDRFPGMTRDITNGRPWKRFRPTNYFLDLFSDNRDVDARYDKTFKHEWFANVAGTFNNVQTTGVSTKTVTFDIGDRAIFIPGPGQDAEWTSERQEAADFWVITRDEYTEKLFPTMNKWIDDTRPNRQHTQGQRDMIYMRLADAYLIRAEARMMQGDMQGAADDLNVVRARGAWPGMEEANSISASDVNIDLILDDRAKELVGECHRWNDLVRTGKLVERVRMHNDDAAAFIQDFHTVRPIPQDQIDRTIGGYAQNPGYPGS